ncbi:hypothetical protein JFL43_02975 [Viridibacillus sp. YIM B01967]|uniref:Lipoprotein n=1 Tax=Viridibacillus soli TaxID=2798301 RepID=A0ABS1H348_9BACL|nr:hypothetical protein [Viridibacillus soli]MBK3493838.1 hypothetical protein [Viridibacillus soli]
MKTVVRVLSPLLALSLLSACSSDSGEVKQNEQTSENNTQAEMNQTSNVNKDNIENNDQKGTSKNESERTNHILTQDEVLKVIKTQLKTNLSKILPSQLPLEKGKHLTATTKSAANHYEVVFFKSNESISINNKLLKKNKAVTVIARISVKKYDSLTEASEQVGFEDFSKLGGEAVDLGYGIKGYQDAGAGSIFTSWNEGRWALTARARTTDVKEGEKLAHEATEFLETHTLPIPKPNGLVHIDVEKLGNRIIWQKENIVYTIDQVKDPMVALEIATSFDH